MFWMLLSEALDDIFSRDSRFAHTLWCLVARPGVLTREYLDGKRARAMSPVRLYLICSLLFFGTASLSNMLAPGDKGTGPENVVEQDETDWAAARRDLQGLREWEGLSLATREWLIERLTAKLNRAEALSKEGGRAILDEVLDVAPPVAFLLLPLFALLLKLAYIRHDVYYAEHLILALHNHSFLFVALAAGIPLDQPHTIFGAAGKFVSMLLQLWVIAYMFISLRVVYRQRCPATFFKFLLIGASYFPLILVGVVLGLLLGLLSL